VTNLKNTIGKAAASMKVIAHRCILWLRHEYEVTWIAHGAHIILGLACILIFVTWVRPVPQGLDAIKAEGRLYVITRLAPTTYYHGTEGLTGFEYRLTQMLAKSLGVKAEYRIYDTVPDLLVALRNEKGHLAAAGLVGEGSLKEGLTKSSGYQDVSLFVVCRRDVPLPKSVKELAGLKVWVSAGTAAAERLEKLADDVDGLSLTYADQPAEVLLAAVSGGNLDCTTANSFEFTVNNPYYPNLVKAFALGGKEKLVWYFAPGSDDLADYVDTWLAKITKSGELAAVERRFAGFLPPFDYVDIRAFQRAIVSTLPDYEKTMRDAARDADLPWEVIAAVAYQESHWNPDARSPTGVRGIMMLTKDTAAHLGVENRLDPVASIHAGAAYIADLESRVPDGVAKGERLWFALTAYNMGFAHMLDARALAERLGLNKNRWTDLRRALSVMDKPEYAGSLKYGRAQGGQALRFVQQVRAYQHILDAPHYD
jgi:membrane-bound lytic murein transglycosylase F